MDCVRGSNLMNGFYWYQNQYDSSSGYWRDTYFKFNSYSHCMTEGFRRLHMGLSETLTTFLCVDERFSNETIQRITDRYSTYPYEIKSYRFEDWQRYTREGRRDYTNNSDFIELYRQTNSTYGKCRDFGKAIAASSDGSFLVIGCTTFNYSLTPNTDYRGCLVVYNWKEESGEGYNPPPEYEYPAYCQQITAYYTEDSTNDDYFGDSVAINRNAGLYNNDNVPYKIIVAGGCPRKTVGGNAQQGAVYIYEALNRSINYTYPYDYHRDKIIASDGNVGDKFGSGIALDASGNTIVIGASGRDSNKGGVYTYDYIDTSWVQRGSVLAPNTTVDRDFGACVALSSDGNVLTVSAPAISMGNTQGLGAVYIFDRTGDSWTLRITINSIATDIKFGKCLSMNPEATMFCVDSSLLTYFYQLTPIPIKELLLTFIPPDSLTEILDLELSSCLFTLYGVKLTFDVSSILTISVECLSTEIDAHPPIPETFIFLSGKYNENLMAGDYIQSPLIINLKEQIPDISKGLSVAVSGDYLLRCVGFPSENLIGRVHLFNNDETMIATHIFWNDVLPIGSGFGTSVSMSYDGSVVAIGSPNLENGIVSIYRFAEGVWTYTIIEGETTGERFGSSVSLNYDGTYLVVGSSDRDWDFADKLGSVSCFQMVLNTWTRQQFLQPRDARNNQHYGCSISLNYNASMMAVGCHGWSVYKNNQGCVYIYERVDNLWEQRTIIYPSDAQPNDRFGFAVSLSSSGNTLLTSAINWTDSHINQGIIYAFDYNGLVWKERKSRIQDERPSENAYFGYSLACNNYADHLVIGTYGV